MQATQILNLAGARLRAPGTWGTVLLFGTLWNLLRWATGPGGPSLGEAVFPFAFGVLALPLAAAPWQWTGDERPLAPLARGLAQALPWTALALLLLSTLLTGHGHRGGRGEQPTTGLLPSLPPRLLLMLVASGTFSLLLGWILADRDRESLRADAQTTLAQEAQALALQAQMNPHVLYNTLGGLAELARENGHAAEEALVRLASLLRRLMEHTARKRVTLDEERGLLEGFLALEQFRLGDRLRVTWAWDEALEGAEVPPLLLQPLVENAIKHGIAPCREGGDLEIGLAREGHALRLWVANTGLPLVPGAPQGMGLTNLAQRLALIGPAAHLSLRQEGDRTMAEVLLEAGHA